MQARYFPVIDAEATGKRINELRMERGLTVRDIQEYFGFDAPQAVYKWQKGLTLPSVDNLLALSTLFEVPMDSILVQGRAVISAANSCGDHLFLAVENISAA